MSASTMFFFGYSLFRTSTSLRPIFPLPPIFSFSSLSIRFNCRASSTATADAPPPNQETLNALQQHPWPEWVTFVDQLRTKGYFKEAPSSAQDKTSVTDDDALVSSESVYTDMSQLKDPCLLFARDRHDIFKSLSVSDIETIVKGGCPNLFRKTVNSAKRLRIYALLDEADVCSACNLRGSCDRAYVILKDHEGDTRTMDVVRILLLHALDPLVISGGEKSSDRELVEASARKLLAELIELSETDPDPTVPKPFSEVKHQKDQDPHALFSDKPSRDVEMKRGDWMCPKCNFLNFSRNVLCRQCKEEGPKKVGAGQIKLKQGGWMCSRCNFLNFSRRSQCLKCNEEHHETVGSAQPEMKKGDWICSKCSFMNFSRNVKCLKCTEEGPKRVSVDDVEMKKGDWNCSECGFMNFANNKACLRCQVLRPKWPGDWECSSCNFLNWRRNLVCRKCNCERPKQTGKEYEEQLWSSPR